MPDSLQASDQAQQATMEQLRKAADASRQHWRKQEYQVARFNGLRAKQAKEARNDRMKELENDRG